MGRSLEAFKRQRPVIVVGMHRSGTTLVTRLLRQLGVWMGVDCDPNQESMFWRRFNMAMMESAGARWHSPSKMQRFLDSPENRRLWVSRIRQRCEPWWSYPFFGLRQTLRGRSILSANESWGWKDPRSTLTLPIWAEVFPNARIIHVVRNGVDVASSLCVRDQRVKQYWRKRLFRWVAKVAKHPAASAATPVPSLEAGYQLWSQYLTSGVSGLTSFDRDQRLEFRFEDLLASPDEALSRVLQFLDLDVSSLRLHECVQKINRRRMFAFSTDEPLLRFYESVRNDPLMRQFSYGDKSHISPNADAA